MEILQRRGALIDSPSCFLCLPSVLLCRLCCGLLFAQASFLCAFLASTRKTFHLVGLLIPCLYYFLIFAGIMQKRHACLILGLITSAIWTTELLKRLFPGVSFSFIIAIAYLIILWLIVGRFCNLVQQSFSRSVFEFQRKCRKMVFVSLGLLREDERKAGAVPGIAFFTLGGFLTILLFPPLIAIAALCRFFFLFSCSVCSRLVRCSCCLCVHFLTVDLILGDLMAAIVGISIGRIGLVIRGKKKTLEGVCVCSNRKIEKEDGGTVQSLEGLASASLESKNGGSCGLRDLTGRQMSFFLASSCSPPLCLYFDLFCRLEKKEIFQS